MKAAPADLPSFAGVRLAVDGPIGRLTLARPASSNAFDAELWRDLPLVRTLSLGALLFAVSTARCNHERKLVREHKIALLQPTILQMHVSQAVEALETSPSVRVILLTGDGKNFCAGIDIGLLAQRFASLASGGGGQQAGLHNYRMKLEVYRTGQAGQLVRYIAAVVADACTCSKCMLGLPKLDCTSATRPCRDMINFSAPYDTNLRILAHRMLQCAGVCCCSLFRSLHTPPILLPSTVLYNYVYLFYLTAGLPGRSARGAAARNTRHAGCLHRTRAVPLAGGGGGARRVLWRGRGPHHRLRRTAVFGRRAVLRQGAPARHVLCRLCVTCSVGTGGLGAVIRYCCYILAAVVGTR